MLKKILIAAAVGVATMGAQASTNLLVDGDFESTGVSLHGGFVVVDKVNGWSGVDARYDTSTDPFFPQSHPGIDLGGVVAGIQSSGSLVSDVKLVAGTTYTASWSDAGYLREQDFPSFDETYTVAAGNVALGDFTTSYVNGWNTHTVTFTATGSDALSFQGTNREFAVALFDNVSVSVSAVPEPASLLLMAAGGAALMGLRRRRQA